MVLEARNIFLRSQYTVFEVPNIFGEVIAWCLRTEIFFAKTKRSNVGSKYFFKKPKQGA